MAYTNNPSNQEDSHEYEASLGYINTYLKDKYNFIIIIKAKHGGTHLS